MATSKTIGLISLILTIISYCYFCFWILITPLIDIDQPIQQYFPRKIWAFMVCCYGGCLLLSLALTFTGISLINEKHSDKRIEDYKKKVAEAESRSQITSSQFSKYEFSCSKYQTAQASSPAATTSTVGQTGPSGI